MDTQVIKMSPEIAKAVVKVCASVRRLGKDDRNQHGGYNFVSVDKFYEAVGPLMADAGIFTIAHVARSEISESQNKKGEPVSHLNLEFDMYLVHESGDMYGPVRREVTVQASGPQAYASAESFVTKYFVRNVFKIPTGDKDDADLHTQEDLPTRPAKKATKGADKKMDAVIAFVNHVSEFLDNDPTPEELFLFEGAPQNAPRMRRIRAGEFDHVPAVADLKKRLNEIYAKAAEDMPEGGKK